MTTITIDEELNLPQTHFKTTIQFDTLYGSYKRNNLQKSRKNILSQKDISYFEWNKIKLSMDPLLYQEQIRNEW